MFRRSSSEILHVRRQAVIVLQKRFWKIRSAKSIAAIGGHIHGNARVDLEHIAQAGGVVGVAVGDHHKIEFGEVDAQGLHVVLKNRGIVPGVEQDPLAVVLDERGKSPVPGQPLRFAEGIVENGHFILGPAGHGSQA
jgi:hypothetical protein